jgi:hypothetical protein
MCCILSLCPSSSYFSLSLSALDAPAKFKIETSMIPFNSCFVRHARLPIVGAISVKSCSNRCTKPKSASSGQTRLLLHEICPPLRQSFVFLLLIFHRCRSSQSNLAFAFRLALYVSYAHQMLYYRTSTPKTWQRSWQPDLDAVKAKDSGTTPHTHCHYYSTRMRRSRRKFRKDSGSCRRWRNDE